ncbi:MAG: hypothetical protein C0616_01960 [Desulfuromonas sp.]|nr:MAG: hypothetical protein C0616_01960 [Desulfuromonas sp.]
MSRLSLREKVMVAVCAVVLVLTVLIFGIIDPYQNAMHRLDRQVSSRQEALAKFDTIMSHYRDLERQQRDVEKKLTAGKRFSLFSFVENLTEKIAAKNNLSYVRPQQGSQREGVREEVVEVKLENLTLGTVVKFLHAVEYADALLQIRTMRIATRFDDPGLLDLTVQIAAYRRDR